MKSDREAFFYYKHLQNIKVDNKDKNQQSIIFSGFKENKIIFEMEFFFFYFTPAHHRYKFLEEGTQGRILIWKWGQ